MLPVFICETNLWRMGRGGRSAGVLQFIASWRRSKTSQFAQKSQDLIRDNTTAIMVGVTSPTMMA